MNELKTKYEKTLQKGIKILKENPNQTAEILKVATRLSYLRGRLFELNKLNDDKDSTYELNDAVYTEGEKDGE